MAVHITVLLPVDRPLLSIHCRHGNRLMNTRAVKRVCVKQCVGVSASVRVYERVLPYLYQYTERRSRGGAAAVVLQRFANKK